MAEHPTRQAEPKRHRPPRTQALARGTRLELTVDSLAAEGDGVARHEGIAIFVPRAAPGDVVAAEIVETASTFARARILQVRRPGPQRTPPRCPVYAECGGCSWQHLTYPAQLAWKRRILVEALRRLGHVADPEAVVAEPLAADPPWRYRHKMAVPFAPMPGAAGAVAGFYAVKSHRIVPFEACAIQHPSLDRALAETRRLVAELGVRAYDTRTGQGDLRYLVGRVAQLSGELLLCLVSARAELPAGAALAAGLRAALPECVGVVQNINAAPGNAILGRTTRVLAGRDHLVERLDGLDFLVSAPSFFQVAPRQAGCLYRTAVAQAAMKSGEVAMDLYAGVGTLSLYLARVAKVVDAVEEVPEAVRDGRRNAGLNGCANVRFHLGPAESVVPALLRRGVRPDVAVLDPPRRGAAASVLTALTLAAPRRIVYVSCNPATLARDVEHLAQAGYRLRAVQPVDMFPQTAHVECSALLERGG